MKRLWMEVSRSDSFLLLSPSLLQQALAHGKLMYAKQLIQTPSDKLKIYVHNNFDPVLDLADTEVDTARVIFTPRNKALQQLPPGLIAQKSASAGGMKPMWKPADQISSVLMLASSADKQNPLQLDGKAVRYTTGHRSLVGSTMPAQTLPSRLTAIVATLAMARGKTPTPAQLTAYYDPKQGNQMAFLLQEAWKNMPKQAIVANKAPSSDDSPDFLGQALNTSPLATWNDLKRSRDEATASKTAKVLAKTLAQATGADAKPFAQPVVGGLPFGTVVNPAYIPARSGEKSEERSAAGSDGDESAYEAEEAGRESPEGDDMEH
ncbi:TPA: hypothetical protein ACH3X1_013244 [Trebouxia sp. C0004]